MIVYRLEHKETHAGPYRGITDCELQDDMISNHNDSLDHPAPYEDEISISEFRTKYYADYDVIEFGCPSKRKLLSWFKGYLKDFLKHDYVVNKYKVKDYQIGESKKQMIFNRTSATFLETVTI